MTKGEEAAYLVADERLEHLQKKERFKASIIDGIVKTIRIALSAIGFIGIALIALVLTIVFWPAALVFLLLCLVLK